MQGVPEEIDRLEHGQVGVKPETWAYLAEVLPEPENDLAIEGNGSWIEPSRI